MRDQHFGSVIENGKQYVQIFLVGSIVKRALKEMKENPDRGIRNLVDMTLQFSDERFQKDFFAMAQTMLQNKNSAYLGFV